MIDYKAVSKSTRICGLAFSLLMVGSGGLIFVVGLQRSHNPYLPIELAAILIGCLGNSAIFIREHLRNRNGS